MSWEKEIEELKLRQALAKKMGGWVATCGRFSLETGLGLGTVCGSLNFSVLIIRWIIIKRAIFPRRTGAPPPPPLPFSSSFSHWLKTKLSCVLQQPAAYCSANKHKIAPCEHERRTSTYR